MHAQPQPPPGLRLLSARVEGAGSIGVLLLDTAADTIIGDSMEPRGAHVVVVGSASDGIRCSAPRLRVLAAYVGLESADADHPTGVFEVGNVGNTGNGIALHSGTEPGSTGAIGSELGSAENSVHQYVVVSNSGG